MKSYSDQTIGKDQLDTLKGEVAKLRKDVASAFIWIYVAMFAVGVAASAFSYLLFLHR